MISYRERRQARCRDFRNGKIYVYLHFITLSYGALFYILYYPLLYAFSLLSIANFGHFYCSFCFTSLRINKALKAGAGTGSLGYMLSAGVLKDLSALTRQNLGHYKGALFIWLFLSTLLTSCAKTNTSINSCIYSHVFILEFRFLTIIFYDHFSYVSCRQKVHQ